VGLLLSIGFVLHTRQFLLHYPVKYLYHAFASKRRHQTELFEGTRPNAYCLIVWRIHVVIILHMVWVCQGEGLFIPRLKDGGVLAPFL
jgi:hypothetical protein